MCDHYTPCECLASKMELKKALSLLILDCWQREFDRRPYRNFKLKRIDVEERLKRHFHPVKDFAVLVQFLRQRALCTAYLSGMRLIVCQHKLMQDFIESLLELRGIELKLMELPHEFFQLLRDNVKRMSVKELSLEGTPLTTDDIAALRDFLINSKTLRHLNVASCSIDQYNFALLADGMHKSTSLLSFNCSRLLGNHLTLDSSKMVHIISELIWQNKFEDIEMRQCEFIAHDMEVLTEYMWCKDLKLRKLNLAYNIIGPDGADNLFRAIVYSVNLTHLDISGNALGTHGGYVVSQYLSSCYRLEYLNITDNDIGSGAMNDILTMLKKSVRLQMLKLKCNKFDNRSANILRRLLDARVVPQDAIDITFTIDDVSGDYRVVPYY